MSDPKPVTLHQKHNFYSYYCGVIERWTYYAECLRKQRDVAKENNLLVERDCEMAMSGRKRGCTMTKLLKDELNGQGRYYIDRDDAGLGVIGRVGLGLPPRTDEEKVYHRSLAAKLGREIFDKNAEQIELERRYYAERNGRRTVYVSPAVKGRRVDRAPVEREYKRYDTPVSEYNPSTPSLAQSFETKDIINDELRRLRNTA